MGRGSEDQKLAYKEMRDLYYYLGTSIYFLLIVSMACILPNVEIVLDILVTVAINCICFFFPATFYLCGVRKNQQRQGFQAKRNKWLEISAYATFVGGVISFSMGTLDTYNVIKAAIN